LLNRFAVSEADYLSAMQEIAALFPWECASEYYQATAARLGSLGHFDLLPHPNERLPYNPVPILLNCPGGQILPQLLYLGLALRDFKDAMGRTKAFQDLVSPDEARYRGALFEIEVGSELVRGGLMPTYGTSSPDFITENPALGIEATMREVPVLRTVVQRLTLTLAFLKFKHLSIEIVAKGKADPEELVERITKDVKKMLDEGADHLDRPDYCIVHDADVSDESTVALSWGEYRYEETLSHLIATVLKNKEEKIRKGLAGRQQVACIAAVDARSLLALPLEPESEYERRMAERHQHYFDRMRVFQQHVIGACQTFASQSLIIRGVLLWRRRRLQTPAEEVHRRYSICLVTPEQAIEIDKNNLSAHLTKIAPGQGVESQERTGT
jgi:hypothetical protein